MYSVNYHTNNIAASLSSAGEAMHLSPLPLTCIQIGKDQRRFRPLTQYSDHKYHAATTFDAISLIENMIAQNTIPDVVLFDLPYDAAQIHYFYTYLHSRPKVASIPVLYNRDHLNEDTIEQIRKEGKVDDLVSLLNWDNQIVRKVNFLKKAKNHPPAPFYRKEADAVPALQKNRNTHSFLKRALDITVAAVLLIISLPIFILAAIAIRLDSRGPVFYTSLRAGKGFRIFPFYKFRTMEVDADKQVQELAHLNKYGESADGMKFLKICNDPRVTRVGNFLRKSSIDELPQLINVLKGDMSLVGNRPLPLYEAVSLTTNDAAERFMAPAGITGLWQVKKKKMPGMTAEERIQLDIAYARNYNFLYDIKIMAQTPSALFQKSES